MRAIKYLIILFVPFCNVFASEKNFCGEGDSYSIAKCQETQLSAKRLELKNLYKKVLTQSASPDIVKSITSSQQSWEKYKDAVLQAYGADPELRVGSGNLDAAYRIALERNLIEQRIAILKCFTGEECFD